MKKIYPNSIEDRERLTPESEKPVTQQQYQDLVNRTNVAVCCAEVASDKVDTLNDNLARQVATANVNTTSLTADNATISGLNSTSINSNSVCSNTVKANSSTTGSSCVTGNENINGHLTVGGRADVNGELTSNVGVVAPMISATNSLQAKNASIQCNLTVNGRFLAREFEASNPEFSGTTTADNLNANAINSDNASIESLETTEASIDNAEIDSALVTELDTNYITHKNDPQEIDGGTIVDHYILLPDFTNGNYFLEARNDGGTKLWSVEFTNSIDNVQMRWSQTEDSVFQLIDLKATKTAGGVAKVQLHVKAFEHLSLFRQSQSTDNVLPPTIYTEDQLPEAELNFDITEYKGTFIQDIIFTNKLHVDELEMDSLVMDCVGITKELLLTCDRDINNNPIFVSGCENQYVQNKIICDIQSPTWVTPATCVSCTCEDLISSKGVAAYSGETVEGDYPIVNLGDGACVHGNANVECKLTSPNVEVTCAFISPHIGDGQTVAKGLQFEDNTVRAIGWCDKWYTYCTNTKGDVFCVSEIPEAAIVSVDQYHCRTYRTRPTGNNYEACQFPYFSSSDARVHCTVGFRPSHLSSPAAVEFLRVGSDGCICEFTAGDALPRPGECKFISCGQMCMPGDLPNVGSIRVCAANITRKTKFYRKDGNICCEVSVFGSVCDGQPAVYNETTNAFDTTSCINLDRLGVCYLEAGEAHVLGDLYVEGTTHTVEEETLSTGSDTIMLRQNNPSSMAVGDFTGIISNKYNGTDNLAFGSGNDGQFRLGHVSGTDTTYTEIYYKDGTWYSSIDPDTQETVSGELTSYSSKTIVGEYTKYEDAVFTVFDYTRLQPALTREEEANIQNNALLKFNRNTHRAEDIAVPTASEQVLTADIDPVTSCVDYRWIDKQPGIYCFATMADYNAYTGNIPVGSQIVIAECNGYVQAEEM